MNQDVKKLWVDALRGGEYKQTQAALHRKGDGYCCLGVLCDLHRIHVGGFEWRARRSDMEMEYDERFGYLPQSVMKWAGVDNQSVTVHHTRVVDGGVEAYFSLASMNDAEMDFNTIADEIENNL